MQKLIERDSKKMVFGRPEPGCALYLPGIPGGGSKIYDRSQYGNNGTITGAAWKRSDGGCWYLDFDGVDDVVNIADPVSLYPSTIKLWVRIDNKSNVDVICYLNNSGDVHMAFGTHGDGLLTHDRHIGGDPLFVINGRWHHFVLAFSAADNGRIYIDGVNRTSDRDNAWGEQGTVSQIGARNSVANFDGGVALFHVSRSLWTAMDATENFNKEKAFVRGY